MLAPPAMCELVPDSHSGYGQCQHQRNKNAGDGLYGHTVPSLKARVSDSEKWLRLLMALSSAVWLVTSRYFLRAVSSSISASILAAFAARASSHGCRLCRLNGHIMIDHHCHD